MTILYEQFETKIKRKATILKVGGFRPPNDPYASWFGEVRFCARDETWPYSTGKPMAPLAQINISELPYVPELLVGIAFITMFIDAENLPTDSPNGDGWELRVYKTIDELKPIEKPKISSHIKSFPMSAREVENDYPCWEDIAFECPEEIEEQYLELYGNYSGFKFGGWPTLIQSEIFWAAWNDHPAAPEYVF